jgi:hypothetical protein
MPFERTLDVLLRLIAQTQQADVAVLSNSDGDRRDGLTRWLSVPLQGSWHLLLGWRQEGAAPNLSSSAPLIEALKRLIAVNDQEARVHELLAQAATLQWKLADAKIADRTAGLIASGDAEPLNVLQHVQKVLAGVEDAAIVSGQIGRLKSELQDRKRIAAAKAMLQRKHGFTEQQSYLYLQQASRRSRRTIADVASELCGWKAVGAVGSLDRSVSS